MEGGRRRVLSPFLFFPDVFLLPICFLFSLFYLLPPPPFLPPTYFPLSLFSFLLVVGHLKHSALCLSTTAADSPPTPSPSTPSSPSLLLDVTRAVIFTELKQCKY